ncbi:short-chain dehydrogenase [Variovorax sp. H27-G14]|uniref:short-chain dehydrogenase n=1 Tax=Variovorax sp. H27-G14 TaxID=3111914 RepID=UPI0038FCDC0B
MRKHNTPIRMITVRPAQPRKRLVFALAWRFGIATDAQRGADGPSVLPSHELHIEGLDLDQRVRASGEW